MIDGEIVIAGEGGLDFWALQQRIHPAASRVDMLAGKTPASFVAFDLLALGDDDLTRRPFAQRRAALERALADAAPPVHVTPITRDEAIARDWFERFEGAGLDGLIAKRADLTYQPDKRVMTKIKHVRTADCVVAGYRVHKSRRGRDRLAAARPLHRRGGAALAVEGPHGRPRAGRRDRRVPDGPPARAVRRAPAAGGRRRRAPVELGGGDAAQRARGRQPLEPQEGPVVRAAAARSGSSRSATTTSRAPASGIRRSSCAGAPTATRSPAATRSSSSRAPFDLADVLAGRLDL